MNNEWLVLIDSGENLCAWLSPRLDQDACKVITARQC